MIRLIVTSSCFVFIPIVFSMQQSFWLHDTESWMRFILLCGFLVLIADFIALRIENSTTQNVMTSGLVRYARKKELLKYQNVISSMDDEELGATLAMAANFRNNFLKRTGLDLANPIVAIESDPKIYYELVQFAAEWKKQKKLSEAASSTLWVQTLHAASDPVLRKYGRNLWKELARGFAHVAEASEELYLAQRKELELDGATSFPNGFTPNLDS